MREGTLYAEGNSIKKKLAPNANALRNGAGHDADEDDKGVEVKNVEEVGLIIEDDYWRQA